MHRRGHRGRNPAPAARRNHRNGTLRTKTVDHSAADHPGPSDDQHNASAVLDAATARFATDGFVATTIRRVAADAGVDASQVMQFFRSKDKLFAAVMSVPASALERFSTAFEGPDEHRGERVVRAYLDAWEGPVTDSQPLMAMLRGAIVNDQASAQLREFIQSRLLHGTIGRSDDDAALRAGLASSATRGGCDGTYWLSQQKRSILEGLPVVLICRPPVPPVKGRCQGPSEECAHGR